jgi:hypothetical protein
MKKIIGFIPPPSSTRDFAFGIPVYADSSVGGEWYFHVLDEKSKRIINFQNTGGRPVRMLGLPDKFCKLVDLYSKAIFVVVGNSAIFVGNCDDLKPYYEVIVDKAGEHFAEEFKTIFN